MDPREYIFLCIVFHVWYVESVNLQIRPRIPANWVVAGTFWLVQGTSLMPFFAVGTNYSPTGNTLEGIETPEYNATVGESTPSIVAAYMPCTNITNTDPS